MKKTKKLKLPLLFLGFFAFALLFVGILKNPTWQPIAAIISVINADEQGDGVFFIDPKEVVMEVTDSYEFSTFTNVGTGQIPVMSDWTATRKNNQNQDEPAADIGLPNCSQSATCTVFAGNQGGQVTLHAVNTNNEEATAKLVIQAGEVKVSFEDEVPEWAKQAIGALQKRNIMTGYSDGRFGAADLVTRAQFVTMLYRMLPYYQMDGEVLLMNKNCDVHSDVPKEHFAYKAICFAYYYGWEKDLNLSENRFLPDQNLTRQEAAQFLYNAIAKQAYSTLLRRYGRTPQDSPGSYSAILFADMRPNSPHADAIGVVADLDLMRGVQEEKDRNFYPLREINRAESATLIWRTMSTIDWLERVRVSEGF